MKEGPRLPIFSLKKVKLHEIYNQEGKRENNSTVYSNS